MTDLVRSSESLPEVLRGLLPPATRSGDAVPVDIPKPVSVTAEVATATAAVGLSTVGFNPLTVTERRMLTEAELDTLSTERESFDAIEKYIKKRREAHRSMVFNHLDVAAEDAVDMSDEERDDLGHYLVASEVRTVGSSRKWVRPISNGAPTVTADALLAVADGSIDGFDHEAYLACTTPIRVIDEEKTLIAMRRNPGVIEALRRAVRPGGKTASLYFRKA